jgi:hypothetical protein
MKLHPFNASITELMPVKEFVEAVRKGYFVDDDGSGYYGTPTHYDHEAPAKPSEALAGHVLNNGYGYVHWFNK